VLERVIADDRRLVAAGAVAVSALAWLELWRRSRDAGMSMDAMPPAVGWQWPELAGAAVMWGVMMVAMMLPSATPMLLLFSAVQRTRRAKGAAATPVSAFAAGYLAVWWSWSLGAAAFQLLLQKSLLLSGSLATSGGLLGGVLLVAAGLYQLTPLRAMCLAHCQSPMGFLLARWRDGAAGAFEMGVRHGAFCVGCCWALMGLLFVGGVMNLLWVAAIAAFVLVEKALGPPPRFSRLIGGALIVAGLVLLARA
jgi:predicted metal-binding membrane protein